MEKVGYAALQIIPSFQGFDGHLERGVSGPFGKAGVVAGGRFGDAAGKSAGSRFGSVFAASSRVAAAGALGVGALAFKVAKDSIGAASDLNESLNAVNVTYGKQAAAVKALGEDAADALGLSNNEFNGLAVQFSGFASQVAGGDGPKVVGVLDELTTRGADFASVMNLEVNEALGLFQSGLAGETEPLRKFGIDLSAAAVQAEAYRTGLARSGEELTEQQKVQARYSLLMRETSKAQGDFRNTSDSLANSQRRLNANWENAQARLGQALLPVLTDVTNFLIDDGIPAFEKAADFFVNDFAPAAKDLADDLKPVGEVLADVIGFLNDLPGGAKIAALGGLAAGGAALKLRGGSAGALGAAGSALGVAKPVPVIVTNPGFDSAIGGGGAGKGRTGGLLAAGGTLVGAEALRQGLQSEGGPLDNPAARGAARNIGLGSFLAYNADDEMAKYESAFGDLVKTAGAGVASVMAAYDTLPKELITDFQTKGIPESRGAAQALVKQYDLTPKEKRTLFELLGYQQVVQQASLINRQLDYAARPREARITVTRAYSNAGYETRGGLQEGGGTKTTQTGRRSTQRTIDDDRRFDRWMDDRE